MRECSQPLSKHFLFHLFCGKEKANKPLVSGARMGIDRYERQMENGEWKMENATAISHNKY